MSLEAVHARNQPQERLISPVSLVGVLAALGFGASGQALQDLLRVSNFTNREQFLTLARQVKETLTGPEIQGETALAFDRNVSVINPEYYQALSPYVYMAQVDFDRPVEAVQIINQWIERYSGFRDVLSPQDVANAVLVIVNALRFKDQWTDQFEQSATQPQPFTRLDGQRVEVPMMTQLKSMGYIQGSVTAVRKTFENGAVAEFAMGLRPDEPFTDKLNYQYDKVKLYLPRFTIERDIDVDQLLVQAGLGSLRGNNYHNINPDVSMTNIKQRVYVRVDEVGAEVRAVTYATFALASISIQQGPPVIRFDRPFHFRISKHGQVIASGFYNAGQS